MSEAAKTDPIVLEFLGADLEERFRIALDPRSAPAIEDYLGAEEYARYVGLAEAATSQHLGVQGPVNLVFVPGVMGSLLQSEGFAGVWWVDLRTRRHIEDLRLDRDGTGDLDPNHQVAPFGIDTSYEPFLAQVLATDDFNHRFFAYDWRKSLRRSTDQLLALVRRIHDGNGQQPVHLVGHSMGGLMIRAALMDRGDDLWPLVGKICFVGTPHYGSPAIASYLKHHFWGFEMLIVLRKYLSRAAFRSLWGVLELLPAPVDVYPGSRDGEHPCANFDLYDVDAWKLDLTPDERDHLADVLAGAAEFHRSMDAHHRQLDPELRARMAMIAGVGKKTLFRLEYRGGIGRLWKDMNKITERELGNPHRDGDGRVPLASAQIPDVAQLRYVTGTHGDLPNLEPVAQDVLRWLRGDQMQLPETPEEALSAHLSIAVAEEEDPGFLEPQEEEPSDEQLERLDGELDTGHHPEFVHTRLL